MTDELRKAARIVARDKLHNRLRRIARDVVAAGDLDRDDVADCFEAVIDEFRDRKGG
jgi:hypothetical protein